jgi:hypothetical protein
MTRRTALALAASVALSAAGATFAVGTTLGLFGAARTGGPTGDLSPVADAPQDAGRPRVETVYVDVTAPPETPAPGSTRIAPTPSQRSAAPVETVFVDDPPATASPTVAGEQDEHESAEPSEGPEGDD